MQKIPTYIVSAGRAGRVLTLNVLPACCEPKLIVPNREMRAYCTAYPELAEALHIYPIGSASRVSKARHATIHNFLEYTSSPVCAMLDDDITGWVWKSHAQSFGLIQKAHYGDVLSGWNRTITQLALLQKVHKPAVRGFTYRFNLAAAASAKQVRWGARVGLVNVCVLMNREAAHRAAFYGLYTGEDVASTLHWLHMGVHCGNDFHLGHVAQPRAHRATQGGCGAHRERHPEYQLRDHGRIHKFFPQYTDKPQLRGMALDGTHLVTTRVHYTKAARNAGYDT